MTLTWYRHFQRNGGLNQILRRQTSCFHYGSKFPAVTITAFKTILKQNRQNSSQHSTKLENIQLDAARIITGGTRLISHVSLYEETKWEKLTDRRNNHKLVLFHKMNYNKTPQYLAELIPKTVGTRHTHNTRQINNIVNISKGNNKITEQSYKGKVKTHRYINRQNQSTTGKLRKRNDPDLVQASPKKWWVE